MVKDLGLAMEIAQQCDIDNAMGQLAAALYGQHQQAGNGKARLFQYFAEVAEEISAK